MTVRGDYENHTQESPSTGCREIGYTLGLIEYLPSSHLVQSETPIRPNSVNIEYLAESIRTKGLLQPIVVRPQKEHFEVIAGNRRFAACKMLGWRKIPCHIVELSDKDAFEVSLIENIQRETMDQLEEAEAYKKYVADFGWGSVSELAKRIGKSTSYISKRISILDLPEDVIAKIKSHDINSSAAEELLSLGNTEMQSQLAKLVSSRHLSMRKVRELVQQNKDDGKQDYEEHDLDLYSMFDNDNEIAKCERAYDKAITTLRIAVGKLATIIDDLGEDNWLVSEMLMQERNVLHEQIDLLLKERRLVRNRKLICISRQLRMEGSNQSLQ